MFCSDLFDKYIDPNYFELICSLPKFPRYSNKRVLDPQIKCFVDETKITVPGDWGLPIPNMEASYKSLSKYAKPVPLMDEEMVHDMNQAWSYTERHFLHYMGNSDVIDLESAIGRMDMSTSTGVPFSRVYPTKNELFEKDTNIRNWLEEDWNLLAHDPEWTCLANNSLKEEMRTAEKLAENSIRTFTAMGLDATCHGTRLFVDQNEKLTAAHLKCSSCVGMSPYKGTWDRLYRKLSIFPHGYALDESQYDSSLRCYMMWGCAVLRWRFLKKIFQTKENLCRIKTYYRNLINTVILTPEGVLVMKKGGNPSGSVNTISDNTLILYTLMAYAWIRTGKTEGAGSYENFEMLTSKALVGDDNTWTVSDEAHGFYNAYTVIEQWKVIGITTTTDCMTSRKPAELDFLSSQFLPFKGMMLPIYSRSKLLSSLCYAPAKELDPAITLERSAAMLSVGWTDQDFRKFCRSLIDWLLEKYDETLNDNPRWISAKAQLKSDAAYEVLFTGRKLLTMQSCMETQERLIKPYKKSMSVSNKAQRKRIRNNRKKGQSKAQAFIGPMQRPARKKKQARRSKPKRTQRGADTSFQFGGAGTVRNRPYVERKYPFSGDEPVGAPFIGNNPSGTVYGSIAYNQNIYPINPGQSQMFPRLSRTATLYERYKFDFLEFYYQHDVSEYNPEGTSGLVYLSCKYDAAAPPPATTTQIDSSEPKVRCMPSENAVLNVPSAQLHPRGDPKFVRPGALPGGSDIKLYDVGNLFVTTSGQVADTTEIGKLYVRYRGHFYTEVLESTGVLQAPLNNQVAIFQKTGATILDPATVVTFPTSVFNGLLITGNTSGAFVFPVGNYNVDVLAVSNAASYALLSIQLLKDSNPISITSSAGPRVAGSDTLALQYFLSVTGTSVVQVVMDSTTITAGTYDITIRFTAM